MGSKRIAYMLSRFPHLPETFILVEMIELERLGARIELFPLIRHREAVVHPEASQWVERAHYRRPLSRRVLAAQLHWLRRRPVAYLSAWARAIVGNARSPRFLLRALFAVPVAASFACEMEDLGVEHVHAHWATHPALAAYVVNRLTGLPYSVTAHAHDLYVDRSMLAEKLRDASFVVTISEYNRRLIREQCGEDVAQKTFVIYNSVDTKLYQRPERNAKSAEGPFTIICVASLQDYKGHPYLIEACSVLKARGVAFRCLLVGAGEDRPAIEALVRERGLEAEVELCGAQPRERVRELLGEADAMVLPSVVTPSGKMEGMPVVLLEALAMELPVVASSISGVPELVRDGVTGLLVPPTDSKAIARALERLCTEPELRAALARAGREAVTARHDLHANVAALHGLLMRDWSASGARADAAPQLGSAAGMPAAE